MRNPPIDSEGGETVTGAELDAIKEAADMRAWEDLNTEDPKAQKAVRLLCDAAQMLERVEALISQAAEAIDGTPETFRVESLNNDAEELEIAVRMQIERMK